LQPINHFRAHYDFIDRSKKSAEVRMCELPLFRASNAPAGKARWEHSCALRALQASSASAPQHFVFVVRRKRF
jgi:hypothetical protein